MDPKSSHDRLSNFKGVGASGRRTQGNDMAKSGHTEFELSTECPANKGYLPVDLWAQGFQSSDRKEVGGYHRYDSPRSRPWKKD